MISNPFDESVLRHFEMHLLAIMGHPLQLKFDYINEELIEEGVQYRYDPDMGPTRALGTEVRWNIVTGLLLQQLEKSVFSQENLPKAKIFLRGLMQHYLQGKPLMTRRLLKVN
jgi:DNA repair protein RecO (recombination protein O)